MHQYRLIRVGSAGLGLASILFGAGGCSSLNRQPAPAELNASLAAEKTSTTAPTTNPEPALLGQTERQRELAEKSQGMFGSINASWTKLNWTISDLYDRAFGTPPATYASMMESPAADVRRQGINGLAQTDFGERPPYTVRYRQMGVLDSDYLVRATAIRSLNRSRDHSPSAMALYVRSLDDSNIPVRLEACKALIHMPTPDAVEPLLRILNRMDEDQDVRIAAADALRHYRTLEVCRTLVTMLSDRDFGVAWTAHRSLAILTGKDMHYSEAAWLAYLTGPDKPFGA